MRRTILIVDDDPGARRSLRRFLDSEGFGVVEAVDGDSALEEFSRHRPDLVLLDVVIPRPNGFEVCERLKADPETRLTPVVMLTGLGSTDDRIRGIETGADDFLSKPIERVELLARVRSLLQMKQYTDELDRAETVVLTLAKSIEGRDRYTEGHCQRLADYGARLGDRMGMDKEDIKALRLAGYVHDIGKVAVPDAVLMKPNALNSDEWTIMRQHPVKGEEICKGLRSFQLVLPIIRHHHERQDGTGYPDGLFGDEVPLTARVLQIVDVFDALITERPYKLAIPLDEAFQTIRTETERGWWDQSITEAFIDMMGETDL